MSFDCYDRNGFFAVSQDKVIYEDKAYRGFAPEHLYQLVPHRLFLDAQVAHVFKLRESSRNDITVIPCHYNVAIIST